MELLLMARLMVIGRADPSSVRRIHVCGGGCCGDHLLVVFVDLHVQVQVHQRHERFMADVAVKLLDNTVR
uniref:Putative secreted protein n=1 Tax=Anopheles marajoara TaxID=58244 RepID=A0A2M4CF36_9DIPT